MVSRAAVADKSAPGCGISILRRSRLSLEGGIPISRRAAARLAMQWLHLPCCASIMPAITAAL